MAKALTLEEAEEIKHNFRHLSYYEKNGKYYMMCNYCLAHCENGMTGKVYIHHDHDCSVFEDVHEIVYEHSS